MRRAPWLLVVVAVSLIVGQARSVRAQRPSPAPSANPAAGGAPKPPAVPAAAPADAATLEARDHFERGIALLKTEAWGPALAEFLRSRELRPTRGNTLNAAVALRKLNRFDEALIMFEALEREFPNISEADKALVNRTISEMEALIGSITVTGGEVGAVVDIDARTRGSLPQKTPLTVAAGPHTVRVYKQGFAPFEQQVDVAGRQNVTLAVRLEPLGRAGTLTVNEIHGKPADVLIDNAKVGTTPWEGSVSVGDHTVILRAADGEGTEPALATVRINQVTPVMVALIPLDAALVVQAEPLGAQVTLDGVPVANGVWQGRLRSGSHTIEVNQDGFIPVRAQIQLTSGEKNTVITYKLNRDLNSPMWAALNPSTFVFEADVGGVIDVNGTALTGPCSSCPLPIGARAVAHGNYELRSGFSFGAELGFASLFPGAISRAATLGTTDNPTSAVGKANDSLKVEGFTVGATVALERGSQWPVLVRLGGGALIGNTSDTRVGTFTNPTFTANNSTSDTMTYAFVAPEIRLARRFTRHLEISIGVEAMILFALHAPTWAGQSENKNAFLSGDTLYYYPTAAILPSTWVAINPSVGLRYKF